VRYAEVLLDVANRRLDQSFHYLVPEGLELRPGMRVLVPLQGRQVQGLVLNICSDLPGELAGVKLRPLMRVVESGAVVPPELMDLALWLAETTICPVAEALHAVWPPLKGRVEEWVKPLADPADPDNEALAVLAPEAFRALQVLRRARRGALPLQTLLQRAGIGKAVIEQLAVHGWVEREWRFSAADAGRRVAGTPGQVNFGEYTDPGAAEEELAAQAATQAAAAGAEGADAPDPGRQKGLGAAERRILTFEQQAAAAGIVEALAAKTAQTVLLHGVTGSGKTEVYREAIAHVLQAGGDAILLVPEISLTSQVAEYFQTAFPGQVCVLHSGLRTGEKIALWQAILAGEKRLVIGARSAVFAPLPNLRLIIVDEEHDGAYKQDENPKYHARDVARKRMAQCQGVVVLGSATPSFEAYAAAQTGKIKLLNMNRRVGESRLPAVQVIDMRAELLNGNRSMFSLALQEKLRERQANGEQSLLLLNRRGYATFVVCRECGYAVRCPNCDIALTYHSQGQAMLCHYCSHHQEVPHNCPECGSRYIRFFGQGTQRLEEELAGLLPGIRVLRLDWDTTRERGAHAAILGQFRRGEAEVLVGTQMIAKGLDFPNVTLVGVVAADQTLNMPDFRARERTFQLLTQVAGRAGRSSRPGEVIIQTYAPADRAVVKAALHDFSGFFWEEIAYRRERNYPPFTHIVKVEARHEKEERVICAAQELAACLRLLLKAQAQEERGIELLGPAPAVLPRLQNQYRWQVAVKGKGLRLLRALTRDGIREFYRRSASNGVSLNVQVDPLGMS